MSKVKIIDRHSEKSIKGERKLLSKLHHPFIVNMYCAFQDYENLYLVMDLLSGGDLRYHLCRIRKFTEEESKFFISCLLIGLEYIHNNNIIHRDIKPENLVSDENGYIRITDFGVAKINKGGNSSETSGTPGYMAPEVLLGSDHSFPVDFFAIGVMGYEFMTGNRPYNGKNRKEIKNMVLKKQVKIEKKDTEWSEESIDFINNCLKRKVTKRLGYIDGIKELKLHKWFKDTNWEELYNKTYMAPFIPKKIGNYDKKYCEMDERHGKETQERYEKYYAQENFSNLFNGYTILNLDAIHSSLTTESNLRITKNPKQNIKPKSQIYQNYNNNNIKSKNNKNNIIINNFNNLNLNFNSQIVHLGNFFSVFKKKKNDEKITPKNFQANDKKYNLQRNKDKLINENSNRDSFIEEGKKKNKKRKKLVKSSSILSLISSPKNGEKLKLDKNHSFLIFKDEANLFSNNNRLRKNNNDTNLSSFLSSNSILNFNGISKFNSFNNIPMSKDKKNIQSLSIEHTTSNINKKSFQTNYIPQKNRNNSKINKLCYNFSCRDLIGSLSSRNHDIPKRNNNSKLKMKLNNNNSYCINMIFKSPKSIKKDKKIKPKIEDFNNISSKNNSHRRININQNNNDNYIQLRQTNIKSSNNLLKFYLPNLNKINSNKNLLSGFNLDKFSPKNKVNLNNLCLKFKSKNHFLLNNKTKKENSNMKRSGSTLLFNSDIVLESRVNIFK